MQHNGSHTVRSGCDCQQQGGREREWGGRGHRGERPINVVRTSQAKVLKALNHKGSGVVEALPLLLSQTRNPPAHRESLTHPVARRRHVVSRHFSSPEESASSEEPRGGQGGEGGKSDGHPVMGCRGVASAAKSTPPARAPTSPGALLTRQPEKLPEGATADAR